jgi:hypothetical protein
MKVQFALILREDAAKKKRPGNHQGRIAPNPNTSWRSTRRNTGCPLRSRSYSRGSRSNTPPSYASGEIYLKREWERTAGSIGPAAYASARDH